MAGGRKGVFSTSCNPNQSLAQKLRKQPTDSENLLWHYLRKKSLNGFRFRRQHPIGNYIVDFVCLKSHLVIELDGSQHIEQASKDLIRDKWLTEQGYKVLRFYNNEFLEQIAETLEKIALECSKRAPPSGLRPPSPLKVEGSS